MTVSYIPAVRAPRPPEPDDLAVLVVGTDVLTGPHGLPRLGTLPDGVEPSVFTGSIDDLPVVQLAVAGTPDDVRSQLPAWRSTAITTLVVQGDARTLPAVAAVLRAP